MILVSEISFRLVLYCAISLLISTSSTSASASASSLASGLIVSDLLIKRDSAHLWPVNHPIQLSRALVGSLASCCIVLTQASLPVAVAETDTYLNELHQLQGAARNKRQTSSNESPNRNSNENQDDEDTLLARELESLARSIVGTPVDDDSYLSGQSQQTPVQNEQTHPPEYASPPNRTDKHLSVVDIDDVGVNGKRTGAFSSINTNNKQQVSSAEPSEIGKLFNITHLLLTRFAYLFDEIANENNAEQASGFSSNSNSNSNNNNNSNDFDRDSSAIEALIDSALSDSGFNDRLASSLESSSKPQSSAWPLETRKDDTRTAGATQQVNGGGAATGDSSQRKPFGDELDGELSERNYFRVLNRVFSRVELPEPFAKAIPKASKANGGQSSSLVSRPQQCAAHIGCVDELPNVPTILKRSNVSASFVLYTRSGESTERSPSASIAGRKISFEPLVHYQLLGSDHSAGNSKQTSTSSNDASRLAAAIAAELAEPNSGPSGPNGPPNPPRAQFLWAAAAAAAAAAASTPPHVVVSMRQRQAMRRRAAGAIAHQIATAASTVSGTSAATTSASWRSASRVIASKELPFDMAALERSGFNQSLPTRIIVGGYFAKEDEEWIDELVRQWLALEPSNVIKVNWADSNRGLYHRAAQNSRIVARQLSLFLHYLSHLFEVDLAKFHLVGHSLGAHIAGFVGADLDGKLARITGLDPAGPIFVELDGDTSMRLDPSDARFVDVVHTNGGSITKGALGLANPSGHVDYYCNGGSLQPGCYFSSMTKSIMDPVERVACNHRRSYRYFTELIKMAALGKPLPSSYRFEVKSNEELTRLARTPELVMLGSTALQSQRRVLSSSSTSPPPKWHVEFHKIEPQYPANARGLYYFRTRSEQPFFSSKQCALTLRVLSPVRRRLSLMARLNNSLVMDLELDELSGTFTHLFIPPNETLKQFLAATSLNRTGDKLPDLWLSWRQRSSFSLIPAVIGGSHATQANELYLGSVELSLLESDANDNNNQFTDTSQTSVTVIRYTIASPAIGVALAPLDPTISEPVAALARAASRRAALVDELHLALTGGASSSAGENQQQDGSSVAAATLSTTTTTSTGSNNNRATLSRNHWHRFEAAKVERVLL